MGMDVPCILWTTCSFSPVHFVDSSEKFTMECPNAIPPSFHVASSRFLAATTKLSCNSNDVRHSNELCISLRKVLAHSLTHSAAMLFIFQSLAIHTGNMSHSTPHHWLYVWLKISSELFFTHLAGGLCSVEARSSQRSGCPLGYWEWNVPLSQVAHRFSLRWPKTETGRRRSLANHQHHLQHLMEKKRDLIS